ncbi:LysR family transcriptional regulator [Cysteiniphilum halobium]|uniref:LysR family transcriptional regulator n=1 Tax=Cysteiniphilum halobium TaxID=2219059 RepID=UPI003F84650F
MFSLKQIETLHLIDKLGSVTKAAEKLHLTQSAVSQQIKQLQYLYDIELIVHKGKKVILTSDAHFIVLSSQKLLQEAKALHRSISLLKAGITGEIKIILANSMQEMMFKPILKFRSLHPQILISITFCEYQFQQEKLGSNQVDFIITGKIPDLEKFRKIKISSHNLVFIAAKNHPLANRKAIPLEELRNYTILLGEQGAATTQIMDDLFDISTLSDIFEINNNMFILKAIQAGLGVALVSDVMVKSHLVKENISILDIKDFSKSSEINLVSNKNNNLSKAAMLFEEFLIDYKFDI